MGWRAAALGLLALVVGCAGPPGPEDDRMAEERLDLAELRLAQGRPAEAWEGFEMVLEQRPDDARALIGGARARLQLAEPEAALSLLDRYGEVHGGKWPPQAQRTRCRAWAEGCEAALVRQQATRALQLADALAGSECAHPRAAERLLRARVALAEVRRGEAHSDQALALYLMVIPGPAGDSEARDPLDPADPAIRQALGRAYLGAAEILNEKDRRDEALSLLSQGLEDLPWNRELIDSMAALLSQPRSS